MKKLLTLAFILFTLSTTLRAQTTGGPDNYGYIWRNSYDTLVPNAPVYNWIDIVGLPGATQVKSLGDDNTAGPFNIGFNFHYYWYDRSSFRIGSNGYIIFNNGALASLFPLIPNFIAPQDHISAMLSDLTFTDAASNPVAGADCWFYTTTGNDSLIVSWISVPFYDQNTGFVGENTFQMVLTSVDSSITFQYKTQTGFSVGTAADFMTIGIENVTGTVGLMHSHDLYPPIDHAIKFIYPATTSFSVTDASTTYNNNDATGGLFLNMDSNSVFLMETEIQNTGNTVLNPFNVTSQIQDAVSQVIKTSTIQSDTLQPAQTQFITHPVSFIPGLEGNYMFITTTQLAGDLVPTNDQKIQELRVLDSTKASLTLQFEDAITPTGAALSWTGGNGGAGYYFIPPFYPCLIDTLSAFIVSNINNANFYMQLFDDDGPFASPGTRLDSQQVFNPQPVQGAGDWFSIVLPTPIQIDSGGFYISWMMDGDGINLGTDGTPPISNRTFEVLGNNWAIYRARETTDLMIRATIKKTFNVGITNPVSTTKDFGEFYPNPARETVSVKFTMADGVKNVTYTVYDMQGRNMIGKSVALNGKINGQINIETGNMKPGIYNCKFDVDGRMMNRRFMVIK